MIRPPRCFAALLLLLGSVAVRPASADFLVNGDFADGLNGWTVTDTTVSVVNGQAVIQESPNASEVDLYQDFTLPVGVMSLSFTLVGMTLEDDFPPSGFGASLLDPNNGLASLVPTVDASTDSFYTRDLTPGTTSGLTAPGVTVAPAPDALPLTITVDLSGLGLDGRTARILFRVIGGGLTSDASATIDNVVVTPSGTIPEPGGLVLLAIGGLLIGGHARRRRRAA